MIGVVDNVSSYKSGHLINMLLNSLFRDIYRTEKHVTAYLI